MADSAQAGEADLSDQFAFIGGRTGEETRGSEGHGRIRILEERGSVGQRVGREQRRETEPDAQSPRQTPQRRLRPGHAAER